MGDASVNERACDIALQMLASSDIVILNAGKTNPIMDDLAIDDTSEVQCIASLWVRRPRRGESLGANYIIHFKNEIDGWYKQGRVGNSKRHSPAWMGEELITLFPRRYNIPSAFHIQAYVGSMVPRHKQTSHQAAVGARRTPAFASVVSPPTGNPVGGASLLYRWVEEGVKC